MFGYNVKDVNQVSRYFSAFSLKIPVSNFLPHLIYVCMIVHIVQISFIFLHHYSRPLFSIPFWMTSFVLVVLVVLHSLPNEDKDKRKYVFALTSVKRGGGGTHL